MTNKRSHTGNGKTCVGLKIRMNHENTVVSVVSRVLENLTQLDVWEKAQWRNGKRFGVR